MTRKRVHPGHLPLTVHGIRWVPVILALFLSGCATVQQLRFQPPNFDLTSVRIDGLGLAGGSLTLFVDVDNPNSYNLRTGQIDLAIDFDGTRFGEAFLDGSTSFGSKAITPMELPLSFSWGGVGAGARAVLARGMMDYTLTTKLTVDTPLGDRPIEVTTRGNVPVR